ncbi:sphingolipid delta-4 desaturase [Chondrus crispus]|uniref:Sphingolipid delta-4 desaturase n=1 Tax=Chondrus crispus TaxID=2769 RepID=R7QKJ1_CHOCR|nr:sphingolipid delta-4 desaturase [Chondrus crispus]CDF38298.1 sphingolipid delta-4 desaturase [Chondrus crispus]|eukprot:XP_005718183.1 sphingolipid delta-4 desaturase [Chondrus crispus]
MPDGNILHRPAVSPPPTPEHAPKHVSKPHWELHVSRRERILREHPSVRELYGVDPRTQFYAYACILCQMTLAYLSRDSYVVAIVCGICFGPYVNAGVLCFMHEATHMLVFRNPVYNRLLSIATNVAMIVPISEIFRQHHSKHHRNLGNDEFDVDVPTDYEISLVGNSPLRKALWLMFNMIILPTRSMMRLPVIVDRFLVLNWVACISFGLSSFLYSRSTFLFFVLSLLNSQGLHPANTRQVQRHIYNGDKNMRTTDDRPTTYSYYGIGNWVTLNVGYHVEHHDFNRIPWTRLPELRRIAGDKWYPDETAYHGRGIPELLNFVMNPNISLADFAQ